MRKNIPPRLVFLLILSSFVFVISACGGGGGSGSSTTSPSSSSDSTTNNSESSDSTTNANNSNGNYDLANYFTGGVCEGTASVQLTAAPADSEKLKYIYPLGSMAGSHVTPVDHQYYWWADTNVSLEQNTIASPADGYIVLIEYLATDYRVVIEHSCYFYTIMIHLEKLVGPLAEYDGTLTSGNSQPLRVPVSAGEVIGHDGGTAAFDFSIHDATVTLGFIEPTSYTSEPWKIHTVDPYDYFTESIKTPLLSKNLRQIAPLGGEINYDKAGTVRGNWFVEGSGGYAGSSDSSGVVAPLDEIGYWNTHLSISPDSIDPSSIIVSLGLYDGGTKQVLVTGEYTPPDQVTVETGLVKYELSDWRYYYSNGELIWQNDSAPTDIGVKSYENAFCCTVLLQLIDDNHLKVETFSQSADSISDFTESAQIYVR